MAGSSNSLMSPLVADPRSYRCWVYGGAADQRHSSTRLPQRSETVVRPTQARQKSLNRVGDSSVYLTVCWMFLWPR